MGGNGRSEGKVGGKLEGRVQRIAWARLETKAQEQHWNAGGGRGKQEHAQGGRGRQGKARDACSGGKVRSGGKVGGKLHRPPASAALAFRR